MGAAASSEAALKRTLIVALGPGASYGRLPQNPRRWTKEQCAMWVREQEMSKVADLLLANDITGEMLLDEANEQDIAALVIFPPLRRKLMRGVAELRLRARDVSAKAPDMSAASLQIQASLDQLNETMRALERTLAQEAAIAEGKPISTESDAEDAVREAAAAERAGLAGDPGQTAETAPQDADLEAAAVKIQALTRGNMERKKGRRVKEPPKSEAEQEAEAIAANELYEERDADLEAAAIKIQALARGNMERRKGRRVNEPPTSGAEQDDGVGVEEDGVEEEEGAEGADATEPLPSHADTEDQKGGAEEAPSHREDEAAEGIEEAEGATSSNDQEAAAIKIQAVTRGRRERNRLREGATSSDGATSSNDQEAAAIKIQAVTRGRRERNRLREGRDGAQVVDPDEGGDGDGAGGGVG